MATALSGCYGVVFIEILVILYFYLYTQEWATSVRDEDMVILRMRIWYWGGRWILYVYCMTSRFHCDSQS